MSEPTMQRTQRARHDLDWLPPGLKAVRWAVAGTLWTALTCGVAGMVLFARHGFFLYGKAIAVLMAGGYYAGDRAARAVLRRRLSSLARGAVDLSRLPREADGELVHVRGRVRARQTIAGLLDDTVPAVYRRVVFTIGGERWVHEAAVDFLVEGDAGEPALIEVAGARWVTPEPKRKKLEGELATRVFALGDRLARTREPITAGELVLKEGDEVEIVGYKSRSVDPTITERLERDTPMRASLRSGRELPLIISRAS